MGNEPDTQERPKGKHQAWLTMSKDAVSVARELVLLLLVALLLLWPNAIKVRLMNAGFTKLDAMGLHWEKQVEEAAAQTGEARQRVKTIEQRIDSVRNGLQAISSTSTDPVVRKEVERLTSVLDSSLHSARVAGQDLKKGQRIQEKLLLQAPLMEMAADDDDGSWAIVISGDRRLDEAEFEAVRARKLGYDSVMLFNRENWIRTVIPFSDKGSAQTALQGVRTRVRETAYLVNLDDWCSAPRKNSRTGVYECP